MLGDLEERVHDDVKGIGDAVGERTSAVQERVSDAVDELPGRQTLDEQVARHPLTAVLGGLGAGVVLGVASGYIFRGGHDEYRYDRPRPPRSNSSPGERARDRDAEGGSKMMDALAAVAMSSFAAPIKDELQTLAREALSGFLGNKPDRGTGRASGGEWRPASVTDAGGAR
jgi:hypothetical protein